MHLIYDDLTWRLEEKISVIDFVFAREINTPAAHIQPFDRRLANELEAYIVRADSGCHIWIGLIQYRYAKSSYPYLVPNRAPYGATISVRQAMIAQHINLHYAQLPKFRVSMLCNNERCVAVDHMIPTSYRSRRHHRSMSDTTDQRELRNAFTKSELEEAAAIMKENLDESGKPLVVDRKPVDYEAILPKHDITPEQQQRINEDYELAMRWQAATIEYQQWLTTIQVETITTLSDVRRTKHNKEN